MAIRPSLHSDAFSRRNLPPESQWPIFEFTLAALEIPDPFNCGEWLLDGALKVSPNAPAIFFGDQVWSYADLAAMTNRLCHVLTEDFGIDPGNRILLRGGNSPMLFAAWLATMKVGAIAVTTMPMLRAYELRQIVEKAQIGLAICAEDLTAELKPLLSSSPLKRLAAYGDRDGALERAMQNKAVVRQLPARRQLVTQPFCFRVRERRDTALTSLTFLCGKPTF